MPSGKRECLGHRVSYSVFKLNGDDIVDAVVRHSCDNTRCVNPDHLLGGSYKDNETDKIERGRRATMRGASLPQTKLSESDVSLIRDMVAKGQVKTSVAKLFSINPSTVSRICSGERRALPA
jgi:hypothetical protein